MPIINTSKQNAKVEFPKTADVYFFETTNSLNIDYFWR